MKKKSVFVLFLLLLAVGGLVFYRLAANRKNEEKNAAGFSGGGRAGATVFGRVVEARPFSDHLTLSGSIEPDEQVDVHPEISGIVEAINFSEGARVDQGQVLVRISDAELRAQLVQAVTGNDLAAENERRAKLLLEKEAISQEEYDIASADHRTAQSQIQLIQAQLDKTVVRAPFAGTIGLRSISKGSYVSPAVNIARLVSTERVKLLFALPEKYAHMVDKGMEVTFHVQGSQRKHTAKVYATEPSIEANTRTLLVKAVAQNPSNKLIPGAFASVVFPLETLENALLVPAEALIPIQNGKKLFVARDGKAREIVVETGGRTESDVLVLNGIRQGDTVLTSGVMTLRDGEALQVNLR